MRKTIVLVMLAPVFALPAAASDFLFGAYQDTDARDDTFGGGLSLGLSMSRALNLQLGASYLQKLEDDPLDGVFDDDRVFTPGDIDIFPLEAGLRLHLAPSRDAGPYLGAGATYFLLDSDRRGVTVDDELGWYADLGSTFGDGEGLEFFLEGIFRRVEATVEIDPDEVEDIDDIEGLNDEVDMDLDGLGMNLGLRWRW